ncbi:MAG: hypothetical protein U0Z53_12625 [Blastocatellia bacterium]
MTGIRTFTANLILVSGLIVLPGLAGCTSAPKTAGPEVATSPAASSTAGESSSPATISAHGSGSVPSAQPAPASGDSELKVNGRTASIGGVKWTVPARWQTGPEKSMRVATYLIPAAAGDSEGGECGVFFFGPGQGGGVQANIDRWIGQFKQPGGGLSASAAKQKQETINGLKVTTVEVGGSYTGGPMNAGTGDKSGYRLLGAIVEGPQSAVFFKLVGPAKTVNAAQGDFQALLRSLSGE